MRSVTYSMTVSLDGYVVGPDGSLNWMAPDEEVFKLATDEVRNVGAHLLGRRLTPTSTRLPPRCRRYRETPALRVPPLPRGPIGLRQLMAFLTPPPVSSRRLAEGEGFEPPKARRLTQELTKLRPSRLG
jgi:hypothetical protein